MKSHPKQGFGIPLAAWFRGPLLGWSRDLVLGAGSPLSEWFNLGVIETLFDEHTRGRADHGKRLYALTMLGIWAQEAG